MKIQAFGVLALLSGIQLRFIARALLVTAIPAMLLAIFGALLIIGSFVQSTRKIDQTNDEQTRRNGRSISIINLEIIPRK